MVKEERMTASGKIWGVSLFALAKREEWNHDLELIGMVSPYFHSVIWASTARPRGEVWIYSYFRVESVNVNMGSVSSLPYFPLTTSLQDLL